MDCLSYGYRLSGTSDNDSIFLIFDVDFSIKIGKKFILIPIYDLKVVYVSFLSQSFCSIFGSL